MRKLFSTLIVLVVVIAVLPWGMGHLGKRRIQHRLDAMASLANMNVKFELKNYQTGWFSSTARIQLIPGNEQMKQAFANLDKMAGTNSDADLPVSFDMTVYHGPIIMFTDNKGRRHFKFGVVMTKGSLDVNDPEFNQKSLENALGDQKILQSETLYHFLGGSSSKLHTAKLNFGDPLTGFAFKWDGAQAIWSISGSSKRTEIKVHMAPMNLHVQGLDVQTSAITSIANLKRGPNNYWYGKTSMDMESATVVRGDHHIFSLSGAKLENERKLHSGKADGIAVWRFDHLNFENSKFGPARLSMAVRNIDIKALEEVITIVQRTDYNNEDKQQQAVLMFHMLPRVARMVNGAVFELDLEGKMPLGEVKEFLKITIPTLPEDKIDVAELVKGITVKFHSKAPKAFVLRMYEQVSRPSDVDSSQPIPAATQEFVKKSLQVLVDKGFLILKNEHYMVDGGYANGKVTFNKHTLSIPELIQAFTAALQVGAHFPADSSGSTAPAPAAN